MIPSVSTVVFVDTCDSVVVGMYVCLISTLTTLSNPSSPSSLLLVVTLEVGDDEGGMDGMFMECDCDHFITPKSELFITGGWRYDNVVSEAEVVKMYTPNSGFTD